MFKGFYKGKRILVTGHTGFKGAWLSLWLKELGARVYGLSLKSPTNPNLHEIISNHTFTGQVEVDIRDRQLLSKTLSDARPDLIFHMAGIRPPKSTNPALIPFVNTQESFLA